MNQARFSLAWDHYEKNICNGLSGLQQNGELVDMTLAADGHFVKVHQVVMALASPFIKQLISSANCPHPVIFLNKISHSTLGLLLEYIYTGEVLIAFENFDEFVEAGQELHIKGLENMRSQSHHVLKDQITNTQSVTPDDVDEQVCYFEITNQTEEDQSDLDLKDSNLVDNTKAIKLIVRESLDNENVEDNYDTSLMDQIIDKGTYDPLKAVDTKNVRVMQYTVTNQGSLQMILNRFLYYLKHSNRNSTRQWRCVDYLTSVKCPAHVVTKDDMVIQRISAHTHPFHDKKILKKVKDGAIFSAIQEAEIEGASKRRKTEALNATKEMHTE
ncbi:unnamed protein product [Chilo suppressalis]|uniref:BTB domain-containing protein n=1 Tax=Chilo suppressalis TaxID=168631 RepID=A0ABN8BGH6_CHISP|nr:unnamed protein product [Chilo suppressalis]